MSSPGLTVNDVMEWLQRVRRVTLPTLPFSGVWRRFTTLFTRFITSKLPSPRSPLPWTIDVGGALDDVIPGTHVSIDSIQIYVSEAAGPPSPPPKPPRARSAKRVGSTKKKRVGSTKKPSVRATPGRRAGKRRRRRLQ